MPVRKRIYWAAFFVPVALYLTVLLAARVIPFGDNTLLLWDANHFYISFLRYWRGVLAGGHDVLYTFNRVPGDSMAGLAAYFLASPLNALLLLFPESSMALFYSVLVLIKVGLCGLTLYHYLQKRYACGWAGLFFSSSYALCGYIAVYAMHVMFLDALILLPLVALGIWKITSGGKPFAYIAALWLTLVCQYYIGYMVCLFAVLYFIYLSLQAREGFRVFLRRLAVFAGASLLAAGLAAAVLVPAVRTVVQGYSLFDPQGLSWEPIYPLFEIFTKGYTASSSILQLHSGGPNLYIGIPLLAFALLYFTCPAIPLRNRLLSLGFAAVFIISFWIAAPYYIWHAFNTPNFFPARFSFLFSFLLIDLAWQGTEAFARSSRRELTVGAAGIAAAFLALTAVLFTQMAYIEYLAPKTIIMDTVFFCATCLLVLWPRHTRRRRMAALLALCTMQAVCLLLNGYYAIVRLNQIWSTTASAYTEQTTRGKALVDRVQAADGSLYRMELNFHRTDTDPFAYDYHGLTHFSPDADANIIDFAAKTGLLHNYYHIRYSAGTTPVLDSLLGVKYILRRDGIAFAPLPEGYTPLWRDGDVTAYQNPDALAYAYLAPPQTLALTGDTTFENQNLLLRDLTGEEIAAFTSVRDITRVYDGTWETYTFPVQANRPLYMKSEGEAYTFNGVAEAPERMNGSILLSAAAADTTYTVSLTAPLGIDLAYFDAEAFRQAHAILAAHAAEVTSDTDSHLIITANVTDNFTQLLITLPYDRGWHVWVDGETAESVSRYNALLAVNLPAGEHTVELRFIPVGLPAGAGSSLLSLALVVLWMAVWRKKKAL